MDRSAFPFTITLGGGITPRNVPKSAKLFRLRSLDTSLHMVSDVFELEIYCHPNAERCTYRPEKFWHEADRVEKQNPLPRAEGREGLITWRDHKASAWDLPLEGPECLTTNRRPKPIIGDGDGQVDICI